jgi:hypothetical protein
MDCSAVNIKPLLCAGAKKRIFFVFGDWFLVFEWAETDGSCLGAQLN